MSAFFSCLDYCFLQRKEAQLDLMASPVNFQSKLYYSDSRGSPSWWWLIQKDEDWEGLVALWSDLWWWDMNLLVSLVYFLCECLCQVNLRNAFHWWQGSAVAAPRLRQRGAFLWPWTPSTSAVLFRQPLCTRFASYPALCLMAQEHHCSIGDTSFE